MADKNAVTVVLQIKSYDYIIKIEEKMNIILSIIAKSRA